MAQQTARPGLPGGQTGGQAGGASGWQAAAGPAVAVPASVRLRDEVDAIGLLAGIANVIMQLSRPAVGYAVLESTVERGQVVRHPVKRARTTFTYLAVAMMGSDTERDAFRQAVNRSHGAVCSGPRSPVAYNAFDPALQRWIAACLYWGAADVRTRLRGPMDERTADAFYREAARFGTTLQVTPEQWPATRAAFGRYWETSLAEVSIDEQVRAYLQDLMRLQFLPCPIRIALGDVTQFVTAGFLPPRFRDEMHLPWTPRDQRRFDHFIGAVAAVNRVVPPVVRRLPFTAVLWDMRVRSRLGLPLA